MWTDWQTQNPRPTHKRGASAWIRKSADYHRLVTAAAWQALLTAEEAFVADQNAVAATPITGAADLQAMAAASATFDVVELCGHNRAPLARVVASEVAMLGKAVQ
jgi:hypothetical protein